MNNQSIWKLLVKGFVLSKWKNSESDFVCHCKVFIVSSVIWFVKKTKKWRKIKRMTKVKGCIFVYLYSKFDCRLMNTMKSWMGGNNGLLLLATCDSRVSLTGAWGAVGESVSVHYEPECFVCECLFVAKNSTKPELSSLCTCFIEGDGLKIPKLILAFIHWPGSSENTLL